MQYYAVRLCTPDAEKTVGNYPIHMKMKFFAGIGNGLSDRPYLWSEDEMKGILACLNLCAKDAEYDKTAGINLQQWMDTYCNIELICISYEHFENVGTLRLK